MRKTEALKLLNLKVVGETGEATTIAELIKFLAENYHGGGGGGAVDSVNGKTGKVELISKDIPVGGEDKRTLDQAVADSIEKINDKTGKEVIIRAEDIPYEEEGLSVHDEIFGKQDKPYIAEAKEKQTIDGVEVPTIDYLQVRQIVTRFGEGTDCRISYTVKPYPFTYQVTDAEIEDGSIFVVKVNTGNGTIVYMANGERVNIRIDYNGITIATTRIEDDIPQISQEEALLIYNAIKSATNTKPQSVTIIYTDETTGDRQVLEMEYAETYDDVVVAYFTKDEICERYKYRITQDDVQGSIVKGSVDGVETLNGKIGNVSIVAGENVNIETEGNNIKVSATGQVVGDQLTNEIVKIGISIESVKELINETNVKTFEVELDATTFLPVIDEKNLDEWLDYAKRGRMVVFHGIDQYQYDRTYTVQTAVNDTIMITAIATDGVAYYIANVTDREWKELGKQ